MQISSISVRSFATYARLKGRYDDDWIDRLNHLYTTIIFIIFTIVVSTKQYVGEPIHCWCPAEFKESMVDYTYCVSAARVTILSRFTPAEAVNILHMMHGILNNKAWNSKIIGTHW
jgi:hypothetical protein